MDFVQLAEMLVTLVGLVCNQVSAVADEGGVMSLVTVLLVELVVTAFAVRSALNV